MATAAMKRIGQLGGYRFLDAYNSAIFQKTAAQKVIYVDSNTGTDSATRSGEDIRSPFATIDYAVNKCTANNLDTILVLPLHAETVTSAITLDTAGVSVIGLKNGNRKPLITCGAAADGVTITAANCEFGDIDFTLSIDAVTAHINIAGAKAYVHGCSHIGSITDCNSVNVYTITADGDDAQVEDIKIYNTVVEVVGAILFEGAATNITMDRIRVYDTIGFTNGAIYDAAAATGVLLRDCLFMNAKAATAVVNFASNSVGVGERISVSGRHTTIASNIVPGTSFSFPGVAYVVEEAAKSGMVWTVDAE